jgi:DNA processing protein
MKTAPTAANFPPRNRLIAALSLGVVVVEASRTSGALITARLAGEMGREVFAVPGDIGRAQTRGTHRLIRDGAKLVETVEDILEELGPLSQPVQVREEESPIPDPRALALNQHERRIYDLLDASPKDIDLITRESGLSAANVASTLMVLELKRMAVQMPGKLYVRAGTLQR